jgi:Xaa-Pro aminopeptidase
MTADSGPIATSAPVSPAESLLARRRRLAAAMAAERLDALLVVGAGVVKQHGYLDWVLGTAPISRPAYAVVLPDGHVTALVLGEADAALVRSSGAGAHADVAPPGEQPLAAAAARALSAAGAGDGRIGVIGRDALLPAGALRALERRLAGAEVIEARPLADRLKAVKDGVELAELTRLAAVADEAYERLCGRARVGVTEAELAAEAHGHARRHGIRDALVFVGAGRHHGYAPRPVALAEGSLVTVYVELCGLSGYWVEHVAMLALGTLDDSRERLAATVLDALRAGADRMRPGAHAAEAAAAMIAVAEKAGLRAGSDHGLGHGVGAGDEDPPRIALDEETMLVPGMVAVLHPNLVSAACETSATVGGTYAIGEERSRRLSAVPMALRRIAR